MSYKSELTTTFAKAATYAAGGAIYFGLYNWLGSDLKVAAVVLPAAALAVCAKIASDLEIGPFRKASPDLSGISDLKI